MFAKLFVISTFVLAAASAAVEPRSTVSGVYTGQATFYATGLTACGVTNKDTDYIAAVSHTFFDSYPGYTGANPSNNPLCGKKVIATYKGKKVTRCDYRPVRGLRRARLGLLAGGVQPAREPGFGPVVGYDVVVCLMASSYLDLVRVIPAYIYLCFVHTQPDPNGFPLRGTARRRQLDSS